MLLSAGRAALLCESVRTGEPELIVEPAELGRRLGPAGEAAVGAHAQSAASGEPPPVAVVAGIEARLAQFSDYS